MPTTTWQKKTLHFDIFLLLNMIPHQQMPHDLCLYIESFIVPSHHLCVLVTKSQFLQFLMNLLLSSNSDRWWKNVCHCLFFSFSSIPILTPRRISRDEGDHLHKPNQHHLPLPFLCLFPQSTAFVLHGAQLSLHTQDAPL